VRGIDERGFALAAETPPAPPFQAFALSDGKGSAPAVGTVANFPKLQACSKKSKVMHRQLVETAVAKNIN
jgi:hypothetical protein